MISRLTECALADHGDDEEQHRSDERGAEEEHGVWEMRWAGWVECVL